MNDVQGDDRRIDEKGATSFRVPVACLCLAGALLACLPHLINYARDGSLEYIADGDQILYMGWSRSAALRGQLSLVDAVHAESGPMMHPWLIFVPPAWIAYQTEIGMTGLTILWRVLGGVGAALGIYTALRAVLRDRRSALLLATFLLFDAGFLFGRPIDRQIDVLQSLFSGSNAYFDKVPRVMAHLRIVPPALAIPFLLAHLAAVATARRKGGVVPTILSGLTFGLLFHTYFYFWTTALAALLFAFVLDSKGRKLYATTLLMGLVIGALAVLEGSRIKASYPTDWLHRTDKFVTIGRFDELLIPKRTILFWLMTTYWVFKRRPDLIYWWALIGAGFVCANVQVIAQLQVENFHWLFAPGIALSLLLAAFVASTLWEGDAEDQTTPLSKRALGVLAVLVLVQVGVGFSLRWAEGTKTEETSRWREAAESLKKDLEVVPAGSVLAGDREGVMLEAAMREVYPLSGKFLEYCAEVKDDELDERLVLNMYLSGLDRESARLKVKEPAGTLSWEAKATRSKTVAQAQEDRRLELIERIWYDPVPAVEKYGVTHILQRSTDPNVIETLMSAGFHPKWLRTSGPWMLWQLQGGTGDVP